MFLKDMQFSLLTGVAYTYRNNFHITDISYTLQK